MNGHAAAVGVGSLLFAALVYANLSMSGHAPVVPRLGARPVPTRLDLGGAPLERVSAFGHVLRFGAPRSAVDPWARSAGCEAAQDGWKCGEQADRSHQQIDIRFDASGRLREVELTVSIDESMTEGDALRPAKTTATRPGLDESVAATLAPWGAAVSEVPTEGADCGGATRRYRVGAAGLVAEEYYCYESFTRHTFWREDPSATPPTPVPTRITTSTPFEPAWFLQTGPYRALRERVADGAALDRAVSRVRIGPEEIEWVRRFASPVSKKGQRKRLLSVRHILLSKERIAMGRAFAREHAATLEAVHAKFGVRVEDLVSMLNAESKFGAARGELVVVAVLVAQMAYLEAAERELEAQYAEPGAMTQTRNQKRIQKRIRYAAENLGVLVRYAETRAQDPLEFRGSWAGAIGIPQFMPASLKWAEDGDGDGRIDLDGFPDAIASTARYLTEHGYRADDRAARRKAFHAYNPLDAYVDAIDDYSGLLARAR